MSAGGRGGVFVSYRREGGGDAAGRLADRLVDRLGEDRVFMDVDAIEPGADYVQEITRAVAACDVLVAVIGPGWVMAAGERGRRLDDPHDWVRVEVGTALSRGVRVIPVLVGGAVMPGRDELPEELAGLARRNALRVRHESFHADAGQLVTAVEQVLASVTAVLPGAAAAGPAGEVQDGVAGKDVGAVLGEADRVARLLREAERAAHSITFDDRRSSALAGVAAAVAATDPSHAAWLFHDAENAARSIEYGHNKARALSGLATAMAATDPSRAARLFSDAERIARSITEKDLKLTVLGDLAAAMAATDPDRAERIASTINHEGSKERALGGIAAAVAATDPDRAERIASTLSGVWRVEALGGIAAAVAATDPDRAERIASTISEVWRAEALGGVAVAVAATDPDRAERIVGSIKTGKKRQWNTAAVKAQALSGVAVAVAATDPDRAELILGSITDDHWRAEALTAIAKGLPRLDWWGLRRWGV